MTYADDVLVGGSLVSTPAPDFTGQWQGRTLWPFPGASDLTVRYLTPDGPIDAVGDATLADQQLLGGVKVHNLRFWNLSDGIGTVAVPATQVWPVVDLLNDYVYNGVTDDSIDAIYGQCPNHTQFRYAGIGNMTINADPSCVDMMTWGAGDDCLESYQACIDAIYAQVLAADPNLEQLHVVFVDNYGSGQCGNNGSGGTHRLADDYNPASTDPATLGYMILIEDQFASNADILARLLGHEVGHSENLDLVTIERVVMLLAEIGGPDVVDHLTAAHARAEELVNRASTGWASTLPTDPVEREQAQAELRRYRDGQIASLRRICIQGIAAQRGATAVRFLESTLSDPDPRARLAAARGLARQPGFPGRSRVAELAKRGESPFRELLTELLDE